MAPKSSAVLVLLAALAVFSTAHAQCSKSPLFNNVAVPLTFCRTLAASKMAGANMIVGFPNPGDTAQTKVLLYTAASHTKVTPVNTGVSSLVQVTSKAVQVLSPTSVAIKFTVVAKTAAFKNLYQIWAFGNGANSFSDGTLKSHPNGARGASHINLITNQ